MYSTRQESLTNSVDLAISQLAHTDQMAMTGKFKAYVAVTIVNLTGVALLNSGNNWRSAISPEYAKKLGMSLNLSLIHI